MCTLIVIHRRIPGAPLVVAANRDEFYDRPAAGPEIWSHPRRGPMLAPRDLRAGGTWLGLNRNGVFAAVTNRAIPSGDGPDPGRRSRGDLVPEALVFDDAVSAARSLEALPREAFNPFNFLVADTRQAFVASYRDEVSEVRELPPGAHVIGNADPDDREHPKTRRIREGAEAVAAMPAERVLDGLAQLCREHRVDPRDASVFGPSAGADGARPAALESTCIHLGGYGTRSSLLLRLSDPSGESDDRISTQGSVLRYAEGAPCENEYRDFTPLLLELRHRAGGAEGGLPARKAS